jgi:polysaccharide deacetylase family protein (PEP-CTERM system associated)
MRQTHLLTIAVEDYFQATAMGRLIPNSHWSRFESRIEQNTRLTLDFLDRYDIKATFFVLGWIADELPEVLQEIVERGHEIASRGYFHQPLHKMLREEFQIDVRKAKEAIEKAIGRKVLGFRISEGHFSLDELWALDILREEGYLYDSSIYPRFRSVASEPWRRFPHIVHTEFGDINELPISSVGTDSILFPAAGGNYFRQTPRIFAQIIFRQWATTYLSPFNMYFHIWELDPELPEITMANWLSRLRMYRNVSKIRSTYDHLFQEYSFQGIASYLDLKPEPLSLSEEITPGNHHTNNISSGDVIENIEPKSINGQTGHTPLLERERITIVIPCYNEELVLPYLANTLKEVEEQLSLLYNMHFLFVDDGSTDKTWPAIQQTFNGNNKFSMVRHSVNRGVAAAILTGIQQAKTEIVCSIDCDCTYDPHQLHTLIPMLEADVAMVTASPYHPLGQVLNVPRWRLFLSKGLSSIYRHILKNKLATYTSCFRVYRRSKVVNTDISNQNFLGIMETLALLDLKGEKIVECPAVLEVRIFGVSKMKTIRTIIGHVRLIFDILWKKYKK